MTGAHIGVVAHQIQGSASPTGCDSSHWHDVLLCCETHSRRLHSSVAEPTRCLANSLVDWSHIQAFLANQLIALDMSPGIRPIGVGETLRRIISKTVCLLTQDNAECKLGSSQLCAGLKCGTEEAIHAANDLFQANYVGMLVLDAKNAHLQGMTILNLERM